MRRTNKTPGQGVCTAYIGQRHLPVSRRSRDTKFLPIQILEAQVKLLGFASFHSPNGNSARKEENEKTSYRGNQSFQERIPFLYFPWPLLYFKSYVETNRKYKVMRGQQSLPLLKLCFLSAFLLIYKVLR